MDQALKSLMASEEEVVTSPDLSGQWHLLSAHLPLHLRLPSLNLLGVGRGLGLPVSGCCHSHNFALLFSPPPSVFSTLFAFLINILQLASLLY